MPIGKNINSEQKEQLLDKVVESAKKLFTNNEKYLCAVVQQKPILNLLPHSIIVTNKRVLKFTPGIFSEKFEDFLWKDLKNAHVDEKFLGCKLILEFDNGVINLDKLPKNQAKKLYAIAQEREEEWSEKNRLRRLEEERAISGGSQIAISTSNDRTTRAKITELNHLLEEGLITQDEYHKKKDALLKEI